MHAQSVEWCGHCARIPSPSFDERRCDVADSIPHDTRIRNSNGTTLLVGVDPLDSSE